jgi:hypothetical protein
MNACPKYICLGSVLSNAYIACFRIIYHT